MAIHKCPLCPEAFELVNEGKSEFPTDWYLYVVHDHDQRPPQWVASVFHRAKGGRFPATAKDITQKQAENRRASIDRARQRNAEKSTNRVV